MTVVNRNVCYTLPDYMTIMLLTMLLLFIPVLLSGQPQARDLDTRIFSQAFKIVIADNPYIYYELVITNVSDDTIRLGQIEVLDTVSRIVLNDAELKRRLQQQGTPDKSEAQVLQPGSTRMLYMEIQYPPAGIPVKRKITHKITYSLSNREAVTRSAVIQVPVIPIAERHPVIIGPPLRSGNWAAVYDPSWARGHRRVIYTVDGVSRIPGRFAIDFIKLDDQGHYAKGDENDVVNWYGYGADVLAVAAGHVLTTVNHFPESKTLSDHPAHPAEKAAGNYISLQLDDNHIAFYEHLLPGSIRVKPGDRVKKGQVIARVGFTGQTTGPHLHFHIADANAPLAGEGLPFVFDFHVLIGSYEDFSAFGKAPWNPVVPIKVAVRQRPAPNSVISFDRP